MNVFRTIPTILAVAWIAVPVIVGAAAEGFSAEPAAARSVTATKADRISDAFAMLAPCATSTWPHVPADCVGAPSDGYRVPSRSVTIERRDEANRTSVLIRMPVVETASR
jgi:hypothetical protein